jgi:5'-nucleotidase
MKILYIDMDGVVADYDKAAEGKTEEQKREAGFFLNLEPIPDAIETIKRLDSTGDFDIYFLSTAPWSNPYAWSEKRIWLEKHLGSIAFKRLILTHNKGLLRGNFLIDDRIMNGVDSFEGVHLHFGKEEFPDWDSVEIFLNKMRKR